MIRRWESEHLNPLLLLMRLCWLKSGTGVPKGGFAGHAQQQLSF